MHSGTAVVVGEEEEVSRVNSDECECCVNGVCSTHDELQLHISLGREVQ